VTESSTELLGTQDLHVHTTMSDGRLTLAEVVTLARERGVRVGIADHVSARTPSLMISTVEGFARYLAALEEAPVWRSAEFCWCDDFGASLPAELLDRLDYRVGSNHGFPLPGGGMGSPWWERLPPPWDADPHGLMDALVGELCRMVRTMPIRIAAHSTLIPPALLALEDDVHAWWTPEREDLYVHALAGSGVALEISNRYRLPHDRLLAKALQTGVRFSLGSDGHTREQAARLEWAAATARRIGITDRELFVPERDGTGVHHQGRT
jgi:histidinol phosphatase-like PHP family hydrolase